LIVLSVATVWVTGSRTILAPPPLLQRPDAASEGSGRTRPPNAAVEPTVAPETPTAQPLPETWASQPLRETAGSLKKVPPMVSPLPETPAPKPLPEVAVSPKKVAPLASAQKRGTQRQSAGRTAPAQDNRTPEPASSDPSDPAGVIDWLLKESARGR